MIKLCITCHIFVIALATSLSLSAQESNIRLMPGFWEYNQVTTKNATPFPMPPISGSECITRQAAENGLEFYVQKFEEGLGVDSNCDLSDLKHRSNTVTVTVSCQADNNVQSTSSIEYVYSNSQVDITSKGTISIGGTELPYETKAYSNWTRACSDIERKAATATQNNDKEVSSTPVKPALISNTQPDTHLLQIGADDAGPINKQPAQKFILSSFPFNFRRKLEDLNPDKPIVVHYTSTDGSCPHCMKNNESFKTAFKHLRNEYQFLEVVFNPWRTYTKKFKRLKGLPATESYWIKPLFQPLMVSMLD